MNKGKNKGTRSDEHPRECRKLFSLHYELKKRKLVTSNAMSSFPALHNTAS